MQNIVAGNWKSQKLMDEAKELTDALLNGLQEGDAEVLIAPPEIYLAPLSKQLEAARKEGGLGRRIQVGAQRCAGQGAGAHTGEVTGEMLRSAGAEFVLVGHSERRESFGETEEVVAAKVDRGLAAGLRVIFCCGEQLLDRDEERHFDVVMAQLLSGVLRLSVDQIRNVVIAYEPVWAIGTGRTASAEQAQEMHAAIRSWVAQAFSDEVAGRMPILYGGSCKPGNAAELFSQPDVNGGLIGGAALKSEDFLAIVAAADA